jgi:hypothetical protein
MPSITMRPGRGDRLKPTPCWPKMDASGETTSNPSSHHFQNHSSQTPKTFPIPTDQSPKTGHESHRELWLPLSGHFLSISCLAYSNNHGIILFFSKIGGYARPMPSGLQSPRKQVARLHAPDILYVIKSLATEMPVTR